ncbi:SOS response-associated peptidase [Steroidobacter sp.]|uniref:SOS response-associated peptidase n=1 Tax=Steroidobacter sp. TaxID=1978227 RepID=UPI001A42358A|nr:SOS response-associated peptidase [Steroidobacter sp.]MBL8265548.1 SOS response-associated peptidase [Steroidobacter sp.]
MCERVVIANQAAVEREFPQLRAWWRFEPSYNVSTRNNVPVVRLHDGEVEGVMMRWGLIPEWAEGDPLKACTTNAPTDELDRNKAFSGAWWRSQRCIVPISGFYGWQLTPHQYLQPYFARLVNRSVFGVAAIWDRSVNKDEDDVIDSCALLTVEANQLLADVHNTSRRMPAILHKSEYEPWLRGSTARARSLLRTYPQERMVTHAVSPRINSLRFNDERLIHPVRYG